MAAQLITIITRTLLCASYTLVKDYKIVTTDIYSRPAGYLSHIPFALGTSLGQISFESVLI